MHRFTRKSTVALSAIIITLSFSVESFGQENTGDRSVAAVRTGQPDTLSIPVKNPTGAMLRSIAIPGWGQWYNEQKIKSVLVFGVQAGIIYNHFRLRNKANISLTAVEKEHYEALGRTNYWYYGASVLISMLDAYIDAHLFAFDESTDLSFRRREVIPDYRGIVALRMSLR